MTQNNINKENNYQGYFDYAASTPVDKRVVDVMKTYFLDKFGNPGSLHHFGQDALEAIDNAREVLVDSFGLSTNDDFRSVIFTGSATEANNLSIRGAVNKFKENNSKTPKIITSTIEHESVIDTVKDLESEGVEVSFVSVDEKGFINLEEFKKELTDNTAVVSIMYVNNELGSIQPVKEISEIIKEFRKEKDQDVYPVFHSDAVQAFQFLDCNVKELGVDLMTVSAHKIYGPKGIGALYIKSHDLISPIITGGGQEFNLRPGTQNTPLIAGFGKAVEITIEKREEELKRIKGISLYFLNQAKESFPNLKLNGSDLDSERRLPHILNLSFPGNKSEESLIKLDMEGIAVSTGAACSARSVKESHVLKALNLPYNIKNSSLRFSFGRHTDRKEIDNLLNKLNKVINK